VEIRYALLVLLDITHQVYLHLITVMSVLLVMVVMLRLPHVLLSSTPVVCVLAVSVLLDSTKALHPMDLVFFAL